MKQLANCIRVADFASILNDEMNFVSSWKRGSNLNYLNRTIILNVQILSCLCDRMHKYLTKLNFPRGGLVGAVRW